jgi:hypothetical protein
VHIIDHLDDAVMLYEEENDTVFLAREVMERLQNIMLVDKRSEARRNLQRVSQPCR